MKSTDRIGWAIIGCGDIVEKRVARAVLDHPACHLRAAYRRDQGRLQEFCRRFDVPQAAPHVDVILDDPHIEVVYIATPVASHAELTCACLARGKHVLVEKPMAMSVAECDAMLAAARQHQRQLGVAYYRRFYPHLERLQQAIQAGELGQLLSICFQTGNGTPYELPADQVWRMNPELSGGGPLMDLGSHRLDLLNAWLGPPCRIQALCTSPGNSTRVETCATLLLEYESGAQGVLQCYFQAPHVPDTLTLIGTEGHVTAHPLNAGTLTWQRGKRTSMEQFSLAENLHAPLIDDFVRAIRTATAPRVTGEAGRRVNEVIEQAYRVARRPAVG